MSEIKPKENSFEYCDKCAPEHEKTIRYWFEKWEMRSDEYYALRKALESIAEEPKQGMLFELEMRLRIEIARKALSDSPQEEAQKPEREAELNPKSVSDIQRSLNIGYSGAIRVQEYIQSNLANLELKVKYFQSKKNEYSDEIERLYKENNEKMDAFVEAMKKVEDLKADCERLNILYDVEFNSCKKHALRSEELQRELEEANSFCNMFKTAQIQYEHELEEARREIEWNKGERKSAQETIKRVWNALGITTYEEARGKYIWDLISEKIASLESELSSALALVERLKVAVNKIKDCHDEGSVDLGFKLYGYVLHTLALIPPKGELK